jgi:DNA-binding CsgD family transcriptional regulator
VSNREETVDALKIVRQAKGPAIATDGKNQILAWNQAAQELLGYGSHRSVTGQNLFQVVRARDIFGNRVGKEPIPFFELVSRGEEVKSFELTARKATGEDVEISVSVVVVLGPAADSHSLVYLLRPVLRRRKADEVIERILSNPGLGGLGYYASSGNGFQGKVPHLTARQAEVLRQMAQGKCADEIANTLTVSVHTVRNHVQQIYQKLGVHSQIEAVSRAFRDRLI